eukprot:CAMPEP_0172434992 /NCGR_PEP_ID=MMETSP1064-20121228/70929_1 /TAXON_ID=202472 /ORGANISM="Aulacoseira subarctica , Strain CCAP 1002/5" /LENGTH=624 /DNA_ID=CAMNT_0013183259 /DNA_START=29 /DNA_END=1904 /DNA_ORIENTATION=-
MGASSRKERTFVASLTIIVVCLFSLISPIQSWAVSPGLLRKCLRRLMLDENRSVPRQTFMVARATSTSGDEESILDEISVAQLQLICTKYKLPASGKKAALVARIKNYVAEKMSASEDDIFYFTSEDTATGKNNANSTILYMDNLNSRSSISPNIIDGTLPTTWNEKGQKVLTFYDSEDRNDLTAFATDNNQENLGTKKSILGSVQEEDTSSSSTSQKLYGGKSQKQWEKENEEAREACLDLIGTLLATTGAPAFADEFGKGLQPFAEEDEMDLDDDDTGYISNTHFTAANAAAANAAAAAAARAADRGIFKGFDPTSVRAELLEKFSKSLRANDGLVLKEAIRDFEVQAVGHDGKAADNVAKGGGHYREVQKVAAFLEGFRKAEVRRIARTTATIILDAIASEGAQGLDTRLATMSRGEDEGELNDALVEYLNDLIRSQEQKVEAEKAMEQNVIMDNENDDVMDIHVEDNYKGNEERGKDGEIVETIDMNDPVLRKQVEQEMKVIDVISEDASGIPTADLTPSEQLLLLLKLVRERIKVEAAFKGDERTKNLRLLAYCLKAKNDQEVERLIANGLGGSLDALNIFGDLIASSIDLRLLAYCLKAKNDQEVERLIANGLGGRLM